MAVTAFATGTQTATIGTEHTLAQVNVSGNFQLYVDLTNLTTNDVVELRVKQIVLTGGALGVVEFMAYSGPQPTDDIIKVSPAYGNELTDTGSLTYTLKQTFGTGRAFPWKVLNIEDGKASDLTTAIPDSVPADGSIPSVRQALYMITQFLTEKSVSSTTITVKKVDGSTTLMTFTLSDASNPVSITRTT